MANPQIHSTYYHAPYPVANPQQQGFLVPNQMSPQYPHMHQAPQQILHPQQLQQQPILYQVPYQMANSQVYQAPQMAYPQQQQQMYPIPYQTAAPRIPAMNLAPDSAPPPFKSAISIAETGGGGCCDMSLDQLNVLTTDVKEAEYPLHPYMKHPAGCYFSRENVIALKAFWYDVVFDWTWAWCERLCFRCAARR